MFKHFEYNSKCSKNFEICSTCPCSFNMLWAVCLGTRTSSCPGLCNCATKQRKTLHGASFARASFARASITRTCKQGTRAATWGAHGPNQDYSSFPVRPSNLKKTAATTNKQTDTQTANQKPNRKTFPPIKKQSFNRKTDTQKGDSLRKCPTYM